MMQICPLCHSEGKLFSVRKYWTYYQCDTCYGLFMEEGLRPDKKSEKERYLSHNNNVNDKKYQKFVFPITEAIQNDFSSVSQGLDFGAGTGPVVSKLLGDKSYRIKQYDPFFSHKPELLEQKYDYIVCCEVIEHFFNPPKEFSLLRKILNPDGKIYCMTDLYNEKLDFKNWYYMNDQTHVFIYHENTIYWIKEKFNFHEVRIDGRLITFSI